MKTKYIQQKTVLISGLIIIFNLFIFSNLFAADIYVDQTLSNNCTSQNYSILKRNCTGSDGNAYKTIKAAVKVMNAGDTMFLRGGTYNEIQIYIGEWRNGDPDNWYTVKSYPGEWAIVDGQHNPDPSITWNHSVFFGTSQSNQNNYIRFENMEITGGGYDLGDPNYPSKSKGAGINMRGRHLEFRYLYIHNNYGSTR
ncbi:MAG: hypothetical protein GXP46_01065, partial [Deferribacteres bacterium]|nr:hypothetical protein [Deferribacteres bacterium]